MKGLFISKPIKLVGQPNCILEITEGPISINISENYENEVVNFSQVKIIFNISAIEQSIISTVKSDQSKLTVLFRLYPGSLVEIEDCDISLTKDENIPIGKHKLICFQLLYCKYKEKKAGNEELKSIVSPTILTIVSSRIEKFYQTIRAAENCIVNIEKSFINKNVGKPLCILNPLIIKVVGSTFEGNGDNAIHLKFVKDDNLQFDSRKLFFKNNEFSYNFGTGIYIDGIENFVFDLDVTIESNLFKKNKGDNVFMLDLFVKSLVIQDNKLLFGKGNGLNLNKIYQKGGTGNSGNAMHTVSEKSQTAASYTQDYPLIEIRDNDFVENNGFGLFMNDVRAQIVNNNFMQNVSCGILLINLNSYLETKVDKVNTAIPISNIVPTNCNSDKNEKLDKNERNATNIRKDSSVENVNNSITNPHPPSTCFLSKNSFVKNGASGLRAINYYHFIHLSECYFKENVEYGVQIEYETNSASINKEGIKEQSKDTFVLQEGKIKSFKNSDLTPPKEANLFLQNCTILNNMKSGVYFNHACVFLENTTISDNLDYAFYTMKEEYRHCFKLSKSSAKNLISGNIGGPWGQVSTGSRTLCTGCSSGSKIKPTVTPTETKLPSYSNYVSNTNSEVPQVKANSDNTPNTPNTPNAPNTHNAPNKDKCIIH